MSKAAPVIIIKKKARGHHGHHGGAWKVAYADFVTAMMAFFLVLWIVGQSREVRAGVAGYFRDPGVLEHERSTGILPGSTTGINSDSPPELRRPVSADDATIDRDLLERSAQRIRDMIKKMPELENLQGQIQVSATPEGLRIELVDSSQATFFDSASATLKPATQRILGVIARELGALGKPMAVEGHTDSRPYPSAGRYTNWELSADRANAARRALEEAGLPKGLIRAVRGFADTHPSKTDDPLSPQNRRVSILVMASAPERTAALR